SYEHSIAFFAPLSSEAISYIEAHRSGAQLAFSLELRVRWQELFELKVGETQIKRVAGPVRWSKPGPNFDPVALTEWHRILSQMEWQDFEFVEVPPEPLQGETKVFGARRDFGRGEEGLRSGTRRGGP